MVNSTHLTIPGKLFLAGEYAVTKPGQPALVVAVDQGMAISLDANPHGMPGTITVQSNTLPTDLDLAWANLNSLTNVSSSALTGKWSFVQAALVLFFQEHGQTLDLTHQPSLKIQIESQMEVADQKLGLGSSAAVTVATIRGLATYFDLPDDRLAQFKEAAWAHYFVQGSGSLGDVASATFTGLITYQAPAWLATISAETAALADFANLDWSDLAITPLAWPKDWQLALIATYQPASTQKALAKGFWRADFADQSRHWVTAAQTAFEDQNYSALQHALQGNQDLLVQTLPTGYLTPALTALTRVLRDLNLAGKVSGAGYGDNGFAILATKADQDELSKALASQPDLHLILPTIITS
ncbi:phosphomevalonate kinase [Fructobacillus ficulneus]|uniref:phosphomevalonate kinase n=1 Tax=Fructobacillus ficulneus TaxID=157463 RepID=A0A0K8MI92_9LACO|nr:phosphomevalonate kinase [Fructobacillus ficulneus]GAP00173.1 phosphomevalonate kinase [Fructobacillus ficulneus]